MKRLIAYSSVSHMGFRNAGHVRVQLPGCGGQSPADDQPRLSTGGLFLIVGLIYDRRTHRQIAELGGLSKADADLRTLFAIIMFSSMGLPGLNGFVGEFLILIGAFRVSWVWGAFAVTGIVLAPPTCCGSINATMFGEITNEANKTLPDLDAREMPTLIPIIALCFWIGLYPRRSSGHETSWSTRSRRGEGLRRQGGARRKKVATPQLAAGSWQLAARLPTPL